MLLAGFEWDEQKNARKNFSKHGATFAPAQLAFADPWRVIADDFEHSQVEIRHFCLGRVDGNVMTVRFAYGNGVIRIVGALILEKGKRDL